MVGSCAEWRSQPDGALSMGNFWPNRRRFLNSATQFTVNDIGVRIELGGIVLCMAGSSSAFHHITQTEATTANASVTRLSGGTKDLVDKTVAGISDLIVEKSTPFERT